MPTWFEFRFQACRWAQKLERRTWQHSLHVVRTYCSLDAQGLLQSILLRNESRLLCKCHCSKSREAGTTQKPFP
ncbi:Cyclin-Y-Like Protein 3-Like [Manis pentadactyla]|nr:Cyclin-Y-Like Protein 3-Like [Manis pentadactyla]